MRNTRIFAAVRCAPPDNEPLPVEGRGQVVCGSSAGGEFSRRIRTAAWAPTDGHTMGTETGMASGRGSAWAGWVAFAGTMLLLIGGLNIFQGIVALIDDEHVVATANRFILVDITSWGWTLLLSGLVMLAIGFGLLAGATWARVAGLVVVGLHAVAQIAWLGAYPVWSLLMIALDTTVIFALTARWSEARDHLRADPADRLPGDALYGQLPPETTSHRRS